MLNVPRGTTGGQTVGFGGSPHRPAFSRIKTPFQQSLFQRSVVNPSAQAQQKPAASRPAEKPVGQSGPSIHVDGPAQQKYTPHIFQYRDSNGDQHWGYQNSQGNIAYNVTPTSKWHPAKGMLPVGFQTPYAPPKPPKPPHYLDATYTRNMVNPNATWKEANASSRSQMGAYYGKDPKTGKMVLMSDTAAPGSHLGTLGMAFDNYLRDIGIESKKNNEQLRAQLAANGWDPSADAGAHEVNNMSRNYANNVSDKTREYDSNVSALTQQLSQAFNAWQATDLAEQGLAKSRFNTAQAIKRESRGSGRR